MQGFYSDNEKLADIEEAERMIISAQSVEELRAVLLTMCRIIKDPIAASAEDADIILGRPRRAPVEGAVASSQLPSSTPTSALASANVAGGASCNSSLNQPPA